MKFYKYQGAGNDFLIADNRNGAITEDGGVLTCTASDGTISRLNVSDLCDRRYGIGADGLMLLETAGKDDGLEGQPVPDFRMAYFNSDGSGGMMCGNGGRCMVAFAADRGISHFDFIAADGFHSAQILHDGGREKTVRLKMKDVDHIEFHDELTGVSVPSRGCFMDTGTRHYVRVVDRIETYDIVKEGREIRYRAKELQPVGANVNFIEQTGGVLKVRTYEKGVEDETFACGTGIVASCIAAYKAGIDPAVSEAGRLRYDVQAKRDSLSVDFIPVNPLQGVAVDIYLTGPATFVAEIILP